MVLVGIHLFFVKILLKKYELPLFVHEVKKIIDER